MSRIKYLLAVLVVVVSLLWPLATVALDLTPDTCLSLDGKCYASDMIHPGTDTATDPEGTAMSPWLVPRDGTFAELQNNVVTALQTPGHPYGTGPFYYAQIVCPTQVSSECTTTWYEYNNLGEEIDSWVDPGAPPEVGVAIPFSYFLGSGVILGVALISVGIVLQRRAK